MILNPRSVARVGVPLTELDLFVIPRGGGLALGSAVELDLMRSSVSTLDAVVAGLSSALVNVVPVTSVGTALGRPHMILLEDPSGSKPIRARIYGEVELTYEGADSSLIGLPFVLVSDSDTSTDNKIVRGRLIDAGNDKIRVLFDGQHGFGKQVVTTGGGGSGSGSGSASGSGSGSGGSGSGSGSGSGGSGGSGSGSGSGGGSGGASGIVEPGPNAGSSGDAFAWR